MDKKIKDLEDMRNEINVIYAEKLAARVGDDLNIPIYLYESAAKTPERKNLATIRSGEYEGISKKIKQNLSTLKSVLIPFAPFRKQITKHK
mgnify:CR=1 FL=1